MFQLSNCKGSVRCFCAVEFAVFFNFRMFLCYCLLYVSTSLAFVLLLHFHKVLTLVVKHVN